MTMAFLVLPTSTSAAPVMYRSLRSPFSSELVASKSNRACKELLAQSNTGRHHLNVGLHQSLETDDTQIALLSMLTVPST